MISELAKRDFYKCKGLAYERGHAEVKAILEGTNPGRVFVDNLTSPNSGLIWLGNNDGFFFIGDAENENFNSNINEFIDNVIKPEARKLGIYVFEGIGNHPKWDKTIQELFAHRNLSSWNQKVYKLKIENYLMGNEPKIDDKYSVVKLMEDLYNDYSIKNIEFLQSKIKEFWTSPLEFFDKGLGYCIIYRNQIVSICFSAFVYGNTHCVDIETLPLHQGKRLAQKAAHAFVKGCIQRDMIPYWDCSEDNIGSVMVAERIGLMNVFNYKGYDFSF